MYRLASSPRGDQSCASSHLCLPVQSLHHIYPCVGFVVSGGHTNLYHLQAADSWQYLGGTIDDAVGEAFDKVAVMLGLPYPGGPHVSRLAASGDPRRYDFPRPMLADRTTLNMSFSGLKTAVRYELFGVGKADWSSVQLTDQQRSDAAASFELAAVECLVGKAQLALKRTGLKRLCVGGGVCANRLLRERLIEMTSRYGVELVLAEPELCTDNAVMGAMGWEKVHRSDFFLSTSISIRAFCGPDVATAAMRWATLTFVSTVWLRWLLACDVALFN